MAERPFVPKLITLGTDRVKRELPRPALLMLVAARLAALEEQLWTTAAELDPKNTSTPTSLAELKKEIEALFALQGQLVHPMNGNIRVHRDHFPFFRKIFDAQRGPRDDAAADERAYLQEILFNDPPEEKRTGGGSGVQVRAAQR